MSEPPKQDAFDLIGQEGRIARTSRMIKKGEKISEARRLDIIERVNDYRRLYEITPPQIAEQTGIKPEDIDSLLSGVGVKNRKSGSWQGDDETQLRALNNWMELDSRRRNIVRDAEYVETSVAKEIYTVANKVAETGMIGVIFGPARIGKTFTLRAISSDDRLARPYLFRMAERYASPRLFARAMARTLQLPFSGNLDELTDRLFAKLNGTKRMLMFDEADRFSIAQLEWLRDLHDETGCPMLFAGKDKIYEKLGFRKVGERREVLDQLAGRVAIRRDLTERTRSRGKGPGAKKGQTLFSLDDIRKIIKTADLKAKITPEAVRWLRDRASMLGTGGLSQVRVHLLFAEQIVTTNAQLDAITRDVLEAVERDITYGYQGNEDAEDALSTESALEIAKAI
jgi:DNA transposition AAA+ family ATPase